MQLQLLPGIFHLHEGEQLKHIVRIAFRVQAISAQNSKYWTKPYHPGLKILFSVSQSSSDGPTYSEMSSRHKRSMEKSDAI